MSVKNKLLIIIEMEQYLLVLIKDAQKIDYKNVELLKRYTTEKGKILPSRVTHVSTKKQKELSLAIKRARFIALLPYVSTH